ncbi:MAG: TIGR00282 family metallophosphoesterase [Planctomycetota bacterium]|nr:TIGR00282 family metallophosphoesterase [Planctomycetota bacterium]
MRILMIGDIVGKPGRRIVREGLSAIRDRHAVDLVIANAENAADGSGLMPNHYKQLIDAGVDCITMGDHVYRRRDIYDTLESSDNIIKPANYPKDSPGRGSTTVTAPNGQQVGVINLQGRVFMKPVDCPFQAVERELASMPAAVQVVIVDFHAEATSDMQTMGRYLDGRVSAVLGTHTHVPTADEEIFPGGTAFQCDVGMTGPHESILGRRIDRVTETVTTFRPVAFAVASGDVRLHGTLVQINPSDGKATGIERLVVRRDEVDQWLSEESS